MYLFLFWKWNLFLPYNHFITHHISTLLPIWRKLYDVFITYRSIRWMPYFVWCSIHWIDVLFFTSYPYPSKSSLSTATDSDINCKFNSITRESGNGSIFELNVEENSEVSLIVYLDEEKEMMGIQWYIYISHLFLFLSYLRFLWHYSFIHSISSSSQDKDYNRPSIYLLSLLYSPIQPPCQTIQTACNLFGSFPRLSLPSPDSSFSSCSLIFITVGDENDSILIHLQSIFADTSIISSSFSVNTFKHNAKEKNAFAYLSYSLGRVIYQ